MTSDECEATGRNRTAKVLELHWRTGHSEFSSLLLTTTTREHGHLEKDTASFPLNLQPNASREPSGTALMYLGPTSPGTELGPVLIPNSETCHMHTEVPQNLPCSSKTVTDIIN